MGDPVALYLIISHLGCRGAIPSLFYLLPLFKSLIMASPEELEPYITLGKTLLATLFCFPPASQLIRFDSPCI